ncbi:MAG: hypothetical protein IPK85_20180 [Gemmatimonadetes bacterium]|nr:hypothetical protein [Gemmatimonadota bacterium]
MRGIPRLMLGLAAAVVACWRDPVGTIDPVDEETSVYLQIAMVDGGDSTQGYYRGGIWIAPWVAAPGGALVVWGAMRPGRVEGRDRTLSEAAVRVAGVRFPGTWARGTLEFGGTAPLPADLTAATIILPKVSGLAEPPAPVVARVGRGAAPPFVTPAGLRIPLVPADSARTAVNTSHTWQAWVTQGARTLEVRGDGLLGAMLALPRWHNATEDATVRILQRAFATQSGAGVTNYGYYITAISTLRWSGIGVLPGGGTP